MTLADIMGSYFKPLRRKIGVLTLGLACVFAGCWVRSVIVGDLFEFTTKHGGTYHQFASEYGAFQWRCWNIIGYLKPGWSTWWVSDAPLGNGIDRSDPNLFIYFGEPGYLARIRCSYWMFAVPLTLLSTWLLLTRPRPPRPILPATENAQ